MKFRALAALFLAAVTLFLTVSCSKEASKTQTATLGETYSPTDTLSDAEKEAQNKAQADTFAKDFFEGKYDEQRLYRYEDLTPYVTLGDFTDLSFPENDEIRTEPTEEEVEKYLRVIQLQTMVTDSEYTSLTEGTVALWDAVLVDYRGEMNGEAMKTATAENQSILIGSGDLIPGFEEGLIGKAIGSEVRLDLTFPVYYHDSLYAGKAATFYVTIKSVERPTLPEYDLAKFNEVLGKTYESMDALKEAMGESLASYLTANRESQIMDYLFRIIKEKSTYNLPEKELANRKQYFLDYYKQYLSEGQTLEENWEELYGITYEALLQAADDAAANTVQTELLILALAKEFNIAPTEEQLSAYVLGVFQNEGSQYYSNVESYVSVSVGYEGSDYFYLQLTNQMLLQALYDRATA